MGTKHNGMPEQLGRILGKRYKETKKTQLPLLKSLEQKQGTILAGCIKHHLRGAQTS